jgi:hypothetical protein
MLNKGLKTYVKGFVNANEIKQALQGATKFVIPKGFDARPDKLSLLFYGTPYLSWLLILANSFQGIEDIYTGQEIMIPQMSVIERILGN